MKANMGSLLWPRQFLCLLLFHLQLQAACSFPLSSNFSSPTHLCPHDQSLALLQFKNSFMINTSSFNAGLCKSFDPYTWSLEEEHVPYTKTKSWKDSTDCCSWNGVTCDMEKGHVIGLDLACSMLQGALHSNSSLFSLHHLVKLDLSYNDFIGSHVPSQFGQLISLKHLYLTSSNLVGKLPSEISHLSRLVSLDISYNFNTRLSVETTDSSKIYISIEETTFTHLVQNLTKLRELSLTWVKLHFTVPRSLMNLSSLISVKLSGCELHGRFPDKILGRPNLQLLDLSVNFDLTGTFPSSNVSAQLWYLDLSVTNFSSHLDNEFVNNHKSLIELHLSYCNIVKSNLALLGNLTKLTVLDLASNNLFGQLPSSFGRLKQLAFLNLPNNNFFGQIPDEYGNLTQLNDLRLSNNILTGPINLEVSRLPRLASFDLFNNSISGVIPSPLFSDHSSLDYVDLSENKLHGPIPGSVSESVNLGTLILSHNKLTGEVSSSICKLKSLKILDLSNNSFSGLIPPCLGNFRESLLVLHLNMNKFQGTIPAIYSEGNSLRYLNFNGNEFKGQIPESLINCRNLELLDLGNNNIEDTFPEFLEILPNLQVLVLSSNKFHGPLKSPIFNVSYSKLRIFDLSNNFLSGNLPTEFFNNLQGMMMVDPDMEYMSMPNYPYDFNYHFSVEVTLKGSEMELEKIQNQLTILDLSSNNFTGTIPQSIGRLKYLKQLNLSHNHLVGHILSTRNLTNLESLDLCSNFLTGRIPRSLVDLTFLEVLNFSNNQLEGPIPTGKQFNTFGIGSYEGNTGLCGFPLPKCDDETQVPLPPKSPEEDDSEPLNGFGWKIVLMGYGCGLPFGLLMSYVVFRRRQPAWFADMVEVELYLIARRLNRKIGRRN